MMGSPIAISLNFCSYLKKIFSEGLFVYLLSMFLNFSFRIMSKNDNLIEL
jgi:hypothetical protein